MQLRVRESLVLLVLRLRALLPGELLLSILARKLLRSTLARIFLLSKLLLLVDKLLHIAILQMHSVS